VRENRAELERLVSQDLARFNSLLRQRGMKTIDLGARGVAAAR
jgi:hypothetical protein